LVFASLADGQQHYSGQHLLLHCILFL
jgi:hypothetical protein